MIRKNYLDNKKILIVDDEPDILDTLEELLSMCKVVKQTNFNEAANLLNSKRFDIAILDIVGVDGYELLEIANKKRVITVILTTNALSIEDTVESLKKGAALFIPKEKMIEIETYLKDILEARKNGEHPWWRWMDRFDSFYEDRFGPDWKNQSRSFLENFPYFTF
jgi:DNA-binding NtrC family response regulator